MSGSLPPPAVAPPAPIRRALNTTTLASVALLVAGGVTAYIAFNPAQPPPNPDRWDGTPRSTNDVARTVLPEPPMPPQPQSPLAAEPASFAPARNFVIEPEPPPEPAAARAMPIPSGQMVTRYSSSLRNESSAPSGAAGGATPVTSRPGVSYKSPQVEGGEALVVTDLERTIRPGTRIGCTLLHAIDGTHPGPLQCTLSRRVMSWDNSTPLLGPGTLVMGSYEPLQTGQGRMMAMAAMATTTEGLMVPLGGAPMTDPLGRVGMSGYVDKRFWERVGNAIITDAALSAIALPSEALRSTSRGVQFNTRDTEQVVGQVLQNSANLPPLFKKNQGEEITILVTQPIHFGALGFEVVR